EAHREDARDPALPLGRLRPARLDRELLPAHRRPDRHHAVAAGAVGPARRAARRRRGDPRDDARHRAAVGFDREGDVTAAQRVLPAWADELRRRYLRGESSMFLLHGNVYDVVIYDGKPLSLSDFLAGALLRDSKQTIVLYNVATGV